MIPPEIRKALDVASQLAEIASDWHLNEVQIDGEMVDIIDIKSIFDNALAHLDTLPAALPLVVNEYQLAGGGPYDRDDITLKRMPQQKGPDKWAIYNGGSVLNKLGEWQYEPLPSSRTVEYLIHCRFDSAKEALWAWQAIQR